MKMHIDITQLVHWSGGLTGIPRVMYELSTRYINESNVDFVAWDRPSGSYVRIDAEKSLKTRGKKISYKDRRFVFSTPFYLAYRVLLKLKAYRFPIPSKVINGIGKIGSLRKGQQFASGDRLFILWGELNDNRFLHVVKDLKHKGVGIIQVSYDMLPLVTPHFSGHSTKGMESYNKAIFPISDLILAISKHTKKDILMWLKEENLPSAKVEVFRLGDDFQLAVAKQPTDSHFKQSGLKGGDFILMVGTMEARKNHLLLYYVYKLALQKGVRLPKLIIVGRKGWLGDAAHEFMRRDPEIKNSVIILESASDEELSWLYENALYSIYPSFYEGWGLPIAESIAHGTPCLCSNTSSMPEVAGRLVGYFNPYSPEECLQKMIEFVKPDNLRKERKKIASYAPTSWDETFKQVQEIIEEAYDEAS